MSVDIFDESAEIVRTYLGYISRARPKTFHLSSFAPHEFEQEFQV